MKFVVFAAGTLLIALIATPSLMMAQRGGGPPARGCAVALFNETGVSILFQWSTDDRSYSPDVRLASGQNTCVGNQGDMIVRLFTPADGNQPSITKKYTLKQEQRYAIYGNDNCRCWDIRLIEPR